MNSLKPSSIKLALLTAVFAFSLPLVAHYNVKDEIETIKKKVAEHHETDIVKTMSLIDEKQNIIATFNKTLYIADKRFYKEKLKRRKA